MDEKWMKKKSERSRGVLGQRIWRTFGISSSHRARLIPVTWDQKSGERSESITLVDAINGFNKLYRLSILHTVRRRYPVGARFTLNFYRHEALLVVGQPVAV